MAKITPIYQFYTHEFGDILYAYNDETNMLTSDKQIGGLYSFIGQGVRTGWEVTKMVTDGNYSSVLNEAIRNEQIELFDGYLASSDSYLGRRISTMLMQPNRQCAAATTANLSAAYNSGAKTLTNNSTQQALSIDSVTLAVNSYVLVKNQSTSSQNGVYIVTNVGSNSTNWVLTRDSNLNTSAEFIASRTSFNCYWVTGGSANTKTIWCLDINKNSFTLDSSNVVFQNAFEQCVRVTPGDGIVGLYKAKTSEAVYFRYFEQNVYYVWATASPCLATESKTLIVSPLVPDYNYDSYNVAAYLASVQIINKVSSFNVIVDTVEYDDRRNALQNLEGAFENALRKAFYRHVHLGGNDHPSKINLSTNRILYASGPVGSTIFQTFDENGNVVTSWNESTYGFPQVRLDGILLSESQYSLNPTIGKLYLKNSLLKESIIQITLPLSPQKKLTIKPGSTITDPIINLTDNLNDSGNELGGTGGSTPRLFKWDAGSYLDPLVYYNEILISSDFYIIKPSEGTIVFVGIAVDPSDDFYVIIERIGREITGSLNSSRLGSISASLFTKNELSIKRIAPLDHVGLARYKETAFLRPTKRLFSSGDKLRYFPEDTTQDLQFSTEIYTIATSVNKPNTFYFGTKRGLFSGTSLSKINFDSTWNPDNGEIIDIQDNVMRSINVNGTANKFKTIYALTNQSKVFRSFDNGSTWSKLKMPFISGDPTQILANAFLASTQIESYEENGLIKYKYYTLLYLGTTNGLYTATILENQTDADWTWSDAWSDVTGNKIIYSIGEIVTQRVDNQDGSVKFDYDRTIYIGSDKGFSVHGPTGAYVSTKLISSEPANGFLWIRGLSANNLLWFTDNKVYISHTARFIETASTNSTLTYWSAPLTEFTTTRYSTGNKIECDFLLNSNLASFSAAPNKVDGVQLTVGDKILVRMQDDKTENGIYQVATVGTGSNGVWTNISSANLTNVNKWVLVLDGNNWARSAWTFLYTEQSVPSNSSINIGTDLISFEELYVNPISETPGTIYFPKAVERTSTNQYVICSKDNPWVITDQKVLTATNEWDYPIVKKVNWNSNVQSKINSIFFNSSQSGSLYIASKEGLYYTTNIDNLLQVRLNSDLGTSDVYLIVREGSLLDGYTLLELNSPTQTIEIGVDVTSATVDGVTTYTVEIISSPTRTAIFPAVLSYVTPISNNRKVTNVTWKRLVSPILETRLPNVYNEQTFAISSDETSLLGLVTNYTVSENFQLITFDAANELGSSFIYENEFINYYVDGWDDDANILVYINESDTEVPFSTIPSEGKIAFSASNLGTDKIQITITKLNKYLSNTGDYPHAELMNTVQTNVLLTRLQQDLAAAAQGGITQIFVETPGNIPLNTTLLDLIYAPGNVKERVNVKVTTNAQTNLREIYLLNNRSSTSIILPAVATEVYSVTTGKSLGIEDKITEAYSNHYYHFNSLSGANLAQLSVATKNATDTLTSELIYPKLFENFFSEPVPVYAEQATRGPKNAVFYDFSITPADTRNSSSTFYVGYVPSATNSPTPPSSFYFIYNASSTGNQMRIGTNNGIWIYDGTNDRWSNESSLAGSSKVYFIKQSDTTNYLMAGTDLGLFEQKADNSWELNSFYPQAIFDHASGSWGTDYTFSAFGKNDGLSFVRTNTSTGEFISDHFDPVDEKNVYGLYKQKFFKLVDDGQGGVKQVLTDALYLCANIGLYGVCEGDRTGTTYKSILAGREMFGANPNKVTITLPDGTTKSVSIKYYKIFNSPKPPKNNQPPVPIIILTSNGVYTVVNWRWCDPADAGSSDFVVSNHNLVGISCTCSATATEQVSDEKFIYKIYVGTSIGVFRSYDDGRTFERCERINSADTPVNDLKSLGSNCILAATDSGLYYSNDEGDTWYKTDETPAVGDACTDIRSSIDSGEYFTSGLIAQTFVPASSTMNKVSLYLGRDDVEDSNPALENVIVVGIYNTTLVSGNYIPNLSSPLAISNASTTTVGVAENYQEDSGSVVSTKKLTDNLEYDKKTYEFSENTGISGNAGLTAIYDMTTSKAIDKMIAQVYYTQNPTMEFDYSDNGSDWSTIHIFRMPIHGGAGKWEDVIWKLADNNILAPSDLSATTMGASDNLTTYYYKVTSLTYLGESLAASVSRLGNSTLDSSNYISLSWSPVAGAISYKVYGRTNGTETLLATVTPVSSPVIFNDQGTGPAGGAASPPVVNTTANLGNHRYYRLSLKDEIDGDLDFVPNRIVRFGDYRIYNDNLQYLLPEKLSASEIEYPSFKSFIINVNGLSTSTTYALVARELDSEENTITDPDMRIVKWFKSDK